MENITFIKELDASLFYSSHEALVFQPVVHCPDLFSSFIFLLQPLNRFI